MKRAFIVNKASRTGAAEKTWDEIESYLKEKAIDYEVRFTTGAGDATSFAKEFTDTDEEVSLFVMGGDGTLNEALNGIVNFEKTYYTPLPAGSANDFVKGIGMTGTALDILKRAINSESVKTIDIGKVSHKDGYRLFGVSAGIGVDAYVCLQALDSKLKRFLNKLHLGSATYGLLTVGDIFSMPFSSASINYDKNGHMNINQGIFIAAMNCPIEGGGIPMVPYAKADSGFLSAFVAHDIKRIKCFALLPFLVAGKHEGKKGFDFIDFKQMSIKMDKPMCVHADGEHVGFYDEIQFECLPEKLRIKGF